MVNVSIFSLYKGVAGMMHHHFSIYETERLPGRARFAHVSIVDAGPSMTDV
jgi:hypothetical protein